MCRLYPISVVRYAMFYVLYSVSVSLFMSMSFSTSVAVSMSVPMSMCCFCPRLGLSLSMSLSPSMSIPMLMSASAWVSVSVCVSASESVSAPASASVFHLCMHVCVRVQQRLGGSLSGKGCRTSTPRALLCCLTGDVGILGDSSKSGAALRQNFPTQQPETAGLAASFFVVPLIEPAEVQ